MYDFLKLVPGQSKVVQILDKIVTTQQIPHAFLFTGPQNVGQHFTAKQLLKSILIKDESNKSIEFKIDKLDDPYIRYVIPLPRGKGETPDDLPYQKISDIDLEIITNELKEKSENPYYEIRIENANSVKISSIRDIKKNLAVNFSDLKYRMIIIEDAHLMSIEAQNALLKSLEEPPEGIIFVLITHKPELLLTTIYSRCWEVQFTSLADDIIEDILVTRFNIERSISSELSPFAGGSIHTAIDLLKYGFEEITDLTINILRYSLGRRYSTAINLMQNAIDESSKEIIPIIITLMITWFNDVQKHRSGSSKYHFVGQLDTIEKYNQRFYDSEIDKIIFSLQNLKDKLDLNINLNLITLNVIFKIASIGIR
ncbi:hypothetical protein MNBD_IGNAVI01-706 [hydrothermal vent metagenome]|uniref:DNA-directed DNA polymerase n=1 Tax=hydrothermal vent metagenome TaxID=652676 RepID=A0A3B1CG38_9ZZZZ